MSFPTSVTAAIPTVGTEVLGLLGSGTGLSGLLNYMGVDLAAVETKLGTGSSTPASNTILYGTGAGTSAWQGLTSAQLLAIISDETGTGSLVFASSPTIVTPTIASFTNATHTHANAAGGGTLGSAAITGIDKSVTTTDSNPYKFRARQTISQSIVVSTPTLITLDTESFDTNNNFSTSTYLYTAPVNGFYFFFGSVKWASVTASIHTYFYKNGALSSGGGNIISSDGFPYCPWSDFLQLTAGDTMGLYADNSTGTRSTQIDTPSNVIFTGFLVSRT